MDEQAALIARRVAMAAAAWFNAPADVEAYRRLAAAVGEWNAYCAPTMEAAAPRADDEELLDQLADARPPAPLGEGLADLETVLRRRARTSLPPHPPDEQGPRVGSDSTPAGTAGQQDERAEPGP
ncbi:hypothetical protein [Nocardioides sp.]|mgnify:FL=1|uniref:hypothetical protein n=1 Tax=Nocardioides sp. TaxID=35761 RepID=UPI003218EFBC